MLKQTKTAECYVFVSCVDESTSGSDEMLFTIEALFSHERFDIHKKCDSISNSTKTL